MHDLMVQEIHKVEDEGSSIRWKMKDEDEENHKVEDEGSKLVPGQQSQQWH